VATRWWARFAFQRWAHGTSDIDFFAEPLNRPGNLEQETTTVLMRRLLLDARYHTLADEFDAALSIPEYALPMLDESGSRSLETINRLWRDALRIRIATQQVTAGGGWKSGKC
jgi:hypothetical protein